MSDTKRMAEYCISNLIDENPAKAASFLAAHFVGLMVALVEAEGGDRNQEIKIDGGDARDITIHAKK